MLCDTSDEEIVAVFIKFCLYVLKLPMMCDSSDEEIVAVFVCLYVLKLSMTCDSSDEEIVVVFICVAGIARRQQIDKKDPPWCAFCDNKHFGVFHCFGTRDSNRSQLKVVHATWMMGNMTSHNW